MHEWTDRERELLDTIRAMEQHQIVLSNIEVTKDFYATGLQKARKAIQEGKPDLALEIIGAAFDFHPMHAESWPGWPDEHQEGR